MAGLRRFLAQLLLISAAAASNSHSAFRQRELIAPSSGDSGADLVPPATGKILYACAKLLPVTLMPLLLLEIMIYAMGGRVDVHEGETLIPHQSVRMYMPVLDVLRLLGALHIMAFHLFTRAHWIFGHGHLWVAFYFVTAGFVYVYASRAPPTVSGVTFCMQNYMRFLAPYAVAVVLGVLAVSWETVDRFDVLTTLTMTQTLFPHVQAGDPSFPINGPLWFMSNLAIFWLTTPRWHRWLRSLGSRQLHLCVVCCWFAMLVPQLAFKAIIDIDDKEAHYLVRGRGYILSGDVSSFLCFHPLHTWPMYLGGMAWGQILAGPSREFWNACYVSLLAAASFCVLFVSVTPEPFHFGVLLRLPPMMLEGITPFSADGFPLFPAICVTLLLCSLAVQWSELLEYVSVWAGRLAMPIYMLHHPLPSVLRRFGLRGGWIDGGTIGKDPESLHFLLVLFMLAALLALLQPRIDAFLKKPQAAKRLYFPSCDK